MPKKDKEDKHALLTALEKREKELRRQIAEEWVTYSHGAKADEVGDLVEDWAENETKDRPREPQSPLEILLQRHYRVREELDLYEDELLRGNDDRQEPKPG